MLLSALISGIGLGSMYGLLALGFYVTYAVSGTVNFAQGSSMMLGAVLSFAFAQHAGLADARWPSLLALLLCALYGLLVEFVAVRPFVRRGSDAWLMATVALGIVLDNVVLFTFGKEPRSLPSPLAADADRARRRRPRRLSAAAADPGGRPAARGRAACAVAAHALGHRACSRWCRTATRRG